MREQHCNITQEAGAGGGVGGGGGATRWQEGFVSSVDVICEVPTSTRAKRQQQVKGQIQNSSKLLGFHFHSVYSRKK